MTAGPERTVATHGNRVAAMAAASAACSTTSVACSTAVAAVRCAGSAWRWCCGWPSRSEEHTSELQSLMRISYAVFCLKKKINLTTNQASDIKPQQSHTMPNQLTHNIADIT